MLKIDRHNYIEQELMLNGSVQISALSKVLQCSEETIRRDLKEMETDGKLSRTQGGAYLTDRYDKSYPSKIKRDMMRDKKSELSLRALSYVSENDVIMMDSSTTCLTMAELLIAGKMSVTIITNSLSICSLCSERNSNINVISLGGTLRKRSDSFVGPHSLDVLQYYYADHSFISCPYINMERGLSDHNMDEAMVRELMMKNSEHRTLLMDHTKFTSNANFLIRGLPEVDRIITDRALSEQWEEYCRRNKIILEYTDLQG